MFASAALLSIYLVIYVKKFKVIFDSVDKKVSNFKDELTPVLTDINEVLKDLKGISTTVKTLTSKTEQLSGRFIEKGNSVADSLDSLQTAAGFTMKETSNILKAANTGLKTFWKKLK